MSEHATDQVGDIELFSSWEGPAEHAPGVLFEASPGVQALAGEPSLVDFAGWVAVTALSGVIGNPASEAIKTKVRDVLKAWRQQKGQAKLDELKQYVFQEMQKHRPNGKLTEEELKNRIDAFFQEIRE